MHLVLCYIEKATQRLCVLVVMFHVDDSPTEEGSSAPCPNSVPGAHGAVALWMTVHMELLLDCAQLSKHTGTKMQNINHVTVVHLHPSLCIQRMQPVNSTD